jgi:hypothetical protein
MPELVSIIIPVYNGREYMRIAIDSALHQTYKHIEILVINDGSDDEGHTRALAESYGDMIRYFEKPNGGVASALNVGINNMRGTFFSWLSHDDAYYADKIEKQVEHFMSVVDSRVVVYSSEDLVDGAGRLIKKGKIHRKARRAAFYDLLYDRFIGGCSMLVPAKAFVETGHFNESLRTVQDYDLWYKMLAKGYRFSYCPIISGFSRVHMNQVSKKRKELMFREKNDLFVRVLAEVSDELLFAGDYSHKLWKYLRLQGAFFSQGLVDAAKEVEERTLKSRPDNIGIRFLVGMTAIIFRLLFRLRQKMRPLFRYLISP